jgi:DNA-binding MarR family transcriptional regulator
MARSTRPQPAVRAPEGFEDEFPGADRRATEAFLNLGLLLGAVRGAVEQLVVEEGLPSMAAFNVLSVLAGDPEPLRPSVIAARMMVTRATTTGVLSSLEARGLIRRRDDASDGRSHRIALTPQGRRVAARLVPRMHAFEADLMGALGDADLDRLLDAVAVLQHRIAELAPGAPLGIP